MNNGNEILTSKETREKLISRLDVLDKVGDLLLIPSTQFATTEQVAQYYSVSTRHIEDLITNNREELLSDGFGLRKADDFITELNFGNKVIKQRGKFFVKAENEILSFAPRGVNLFPKRAILRIGMLLKDSNVAKEIRTKLLDIVQDTEKVNPEIIQNVVNEITEEKQLMLDRVEAEMSGDYDKVCIVNAKLFALKNKRIKELETNIENITTNALTITESKSVINRIVRTIATTAKYSKCFGEAWNVFYSKLNYQLGINIKARGKKNNSYLNSLTDKEVQATEKIARSWALELGLNLAELLSLS